MTQDPNMISNDSRNGISNSLKEKINTSMSKQRDGSIQKMTTSVSQNNIMGNSNTAKTVI